MCQPLRYQELDKETKDRIELKEEEDRSFYRVLDSDYTEQMFQTISTRRSHKIEHSYIFSCYGSQGCFRGDTTLFVVVDGVIKCKSISEVELGDEVLSWDDFGKKIVIKPVVNKFRYFSRINKVSVKYGGDIFATGGHKFVVLENGQFVKKKLCELRKGDFLVYNSDFSEFEGLWGEKYSYEMSWLAGAYAADGHINSKKTGRTVYITKKECNTVERIKEFCKKLGYECVYKSSNKKHKFVFYIYSEEFTELAREIGSGSGNKRVPMGINVAGFLSGYVNGDCEFNLNGTGNKKKVGFELMTKSLKLAEGIQFLFMLRGIPLSLTTFVVPSGLYKGNKYYSLNADSRTVRLIKESLDVVNSKFDVEHTVDCFTDYKFAYSSKGLAGCGKLDNARKSECRDVSKSVRRAFKRGYINRSSVCVWLNYLPNNSFLQGAQEFFSRNFYCMQISDISEAESDYVYDITVEDTNNYFLSSGLLSSNSGKSYLSLSTLGLLDSKFSVDNVFFSYDDLVHKRSQLKPNTSVLMDEQSPSYGMDSHRVMIILNALKEQLRKRSIHMGFCSPVLQQEYLSSHYVIEPLFINYKTEEVVAAYKTRELQNLGHVHIPHPKKVVGADFLKAYEEKKDAHLERLTGNRQVDEIEERCKHVVNHMIFKMAEFTYLKARGFVPMNMLMQVVGKIYPEYKQSVICSEIASRIKLNKELEGKWRVAK